MFRVAERLAQREGAGALVTGESLGQVASQTLENIRATDASVTLPVFRPLIGNDKLEIIDQAQQLGTFEISSMDAPDCCTLFMPRSPETHARLEDVEAAEADLPSERWVEELAAAARRGVGARQPGSRGRLRASYFLRQEPPLGRGGADPQSPPRRGAGKRGRPALLAPPPMGRPRVGGGG